MNVDAMSRQGYPQDWKEISLAIRNRAGHRCEDCGAENYKAHPVTGSMTILAVAHLDHTPSNCHPENLRALCQKCHATYDSKHRAGKLIIAREKKWVPVTRWGDWELPRWLNEERITQAEGARRLRLSATTFHNLLSRRRQPSLELAHRIYTDTGGKVPMACWFSVS